MFSRADGWIRRRNTPQVVAIGFAGFLLLGTLLLAAPFCSATGEKTAFTDAAFTAATSVCVTGLVTVNMARHWNLFGKMVILTLIQCGGIGVVAMASFLFISLHRRLSLHNRRMIQESYHIHTAEGLAGLVKRIVSCVFLAELLGTLLYALTFVPQFGLSRGLAYAAFTAVSAFCNAGIDLFGAHSLMQYQKDPLVNFTTIGLVVVSGLGFSVWWDVTDKLKQIFGGRLTFRRWYRTLHLHSQMTLLTTFLLLAAGTLLIFVFEYQNPATMAGLPLLQKLQASLFQAATTRTAGFYTVEQSSLSQASVILCLFFMLVGGSPMGTAGGIKTTTLAVLALSVAAHIQGKTDVEFHNRRIREGYLRSAVVVTAMALFVFLLASMWLAFLMPQENLTDIFYETMSAAGTVGLSRGLTARLTKPGKWLMILLMYLGRIGPLTLGSAVFLRVQKRSGSSHLAEEEIMIG